MSLNILVMKHRVGDSREDTMASEIDRQMVGFALCMTVIAKAVVLGLPTVGVLGLLESFVM